MFKLQTTKSEPVTLPQDFASNTRIQNWSDIKQLLHEVHYSVDGEDPAEGWTFVTSASTSDIDSKDDLIDYTNSTSPGDSGFKKYPPDIYMILVLVTISLICLSLVIYACYKAVKKLKLAHRDATNPESPPDETTQQSGTLNRLANGKTVL